jgi:hypothetical protein
LENISLNFISNAGFDITGDLTESQRKEIKENDNLQEFVISWAENHIAEEKYKAEKNRLTLEVEKL